MNSANIGFEVAILEGNVGVATGTREGNRRLHRFISGRRRKRNLPEIECGIDECNTVSVDAILRQLRVQFT